jgi:hypothetical protein
VITQMLSTQSDAVALGPSAGQLPAVHVATQRKPSTASKSHVGVGFPQRTAHDPHVAADVRSASQLVGSQSQLAVFGAQLTG